jgi:hypothetical protein
MTQQYQSFHSVQHEFPQSCLDIKVKALLFVWNVPLTQILIGVADDIQKDQADQQNLPIIIFKEKSNIVGVF